MRAVLQLNVENLKECPPSSLADLYGTLPMGANLREYSI